MAAKIINNRLENCTQLGPWMHTASAVRNFQLRPRTATRFASRRIEDRFERKGHEFVVLDVVTLGEDRVIEQVRHTAIWRPRKS